MSDHIRVDESYVNALLGHAAWDKSEVIISESASTEEVIEEEEESVHFCPLCESLLEESVSPELYDEFFVALEEAAAGTEEEEEDLEEEKEPTEKDLADANKAVHKKGPKGSPEDEEANKKIDNAMGSATKGTPGGIDALKKGIRAAGKKAVADNEEDREKKGVN